MSESLTIIARIRAKPGQEAQLLRELRLLPGPTRAEPGCITYELLQSPSDPALFMFYERWANQAALDQHFKTPHFLALVKVIPELAEAPPEITKWVIVK